MGKTTIHADRSRVSLIDEITADVKEFDGALAATTEHDHTNAEVCPSCIPHLARATDLYRGDFLEGFSVRDAPEFEDWARSVAESFRAKVGEAFNRLAMARAAGSDYPGAIAAVGRWVDLDPLHEPAHRMLMLLHAWAGDRPKAIEAYRDFVAILDTELGVPPLQETTELYEAILDEDLPPAPGMRRRIAAKPGPPSPDSHLLDRVEELGALREAIVSAGQGGQVCHLTGAAWMGKTRLIEEMGPDVEGTPILIGRAFRMEQNIPFGVATQILRTMDELMVATGSQVPGWALDELSRIIPSAGGSRPQFESDPFGESRLLEAIHAVVNAISADLPLAIVIDDLQWIDEASARIIAYLSRRMSEMRVTLIVTTRAGEQLGDLNSEVVSSADQTIELLPLTSAAISSLVSDPDEASRLIEHTGGVPLLLIEATKDVDPPPEITPGVVRYMKARLREVGELARQVLATASVLTGVCDASLLRDVSGRTDEEVVDAVEELIAARLLREIPGTDTLGFTLDSLEKVTYDSISLIRRRLLHRRAAQALASRPRAASDPRLAAAVANQFHGAGEAEAAAWYRVAGDLAREVFAHTEARTFYETSLALGNSDSADLRLALGELALTRGDYASANRELTAAAAQGEGATLGLVEHRLGLVQRHLGKFPLAMEHFERSEPLHPEPAYLHADWALLHHRLGNHDTAVRMGRKAAEIAENVGDARMMSRAINVLAVVSENTDQAIAHLNRAIELAGDDEILRMAALNNLAFTLSRSGDEEGAVQLVEEAIDLASQTGHRHREAALLNHLADLHHRAGRPDKAEQALTKAVTVFADIDAGSWEPEVWLLSQW